MTQFTQFLPKTVFSADFYGIIIKYEKFKGVKDEKISFFTFYNNRFYGVFLL